MIFVDTSAFLAVMAGDDRYHPRARAIWLRLLNRSVTLVSTNYVLLETLTLLQARIGMSAVRAFQEEVLPILAVEWVTPSLHQAALAALVANDRRKISLTDHVSFLVMRERGLRRVFAFDRHFREQGFEPVNGAG